MDNPLDSDNVFELSSLIREKGKGLSYDEIKKRIIKVLSNSPTSSLSSDSDYDPMGGPCAQDPNDI